MPDQTEQLIRYVRRNLWLVLGITVLLGAYAVLLAVFPDSAATAAADRAAAFLPLALIIAVTASRASVRHLPAEMKSRPMQRILNDELRQASLQAAWRNGFIAMLCAQPVLLAATALLPIAHATALMASLSLVAGVATAIATVLACDR